MRRQRAAVVGQVLDDEMLRKFAPRKHAALTKEDLVKEFDLKVHTSNLANVHHKELLSMAILANLKHKSNTVHNAGRPCPVSDTMSRSFEPKWASTRNTGPQKGSRSIQPAWSNRPRRENGCRLLPLRLRTLDQKWCISPKKIWASAWVTSSTPK